ncbi:MAG: hypothetical protein DMG71_16550 [Acidobacteria bacterium]|nr:MAG: hypothetical protein DMG71_16550 [Acidobacteriota bacterium]
MNFSASRLAILSVLGVVSAAATAAQQPVWHVSSLKATIVVNPDSSLLVDETLIIPESSDPNFGLRCHIPIGDNDRWDRNYGPGYTDDNGLRVKVETVTVDGQVVAFHLDHYRHSSYQLIVGKENRRYTVAPGEHELHVIYRITGAIRSVDKNDELYWNVAGHTPMAYDSLSVRVYLPSGVPGEWLQISAYAGGRGVSQPRTKADPPIETTKLSDGAEFSIADLHSLQSLAIVMRWPQGYIHRPTFREQYGSPYYLAPLLLLMIYISARMYLRRNMEEYSTAPQYEPPAGLSPAALRYIMRGGVDGTSLASSLASLAVRGYVEVQAKGASYAFWRTQKCDTDPGKLPAEEAAIAQLLFDASANVADPACGTRNDFQDLTELTLETSSSYNGRTGAVSFGPNDPRINVLVGAMYARLKPQLEGKYFTWNAWIVLLGMLATLIFGVAVVLSAGQEMGSLFLAFWSFGFFQTFSAIMGLALLGRQRKPVAAVLVSLAFVGATFLAARELARDISWVPVGSYIAMIVLNGIFLPLLRTPTTEGQKLLSQIRGYKMFLEETELGPLTELGKTPDAMPKLTSLPYAIALDVKEPWGDAMATSFAAATTCV